MLVGPMPMRGGDGEIAALIESLYRTGERLEELTHGEVDAVADGAGRTFLLQRAQERLRDREADKQEAILNALPANLALLDGRGVIVSVNNAWRDFGIANDLRAPGLGVGLDYAAVCERATGDEAEMGAVAARGIRDVIAGAVANFSVEYPCHSPTQKRWFLMKVTPLAGGDAAGAVVMHIDISAQHRIREDLRASEVRFRQMAESIRDIFFLVDMPTGRVLYMSPAYEAISGHTCESACEDPNAWYEAMHPDDRAGAREAAAAAISQAREYRHEFRFLRTDGVVRWMAVRGFPVREGGGHVLRMACVAEDVSNRKQRMEELEQVHQRLVLASRRAGMAEVATNILHNVGNVLNSVNVSATLAAESVQGTRAGALAEVVAMLRAHEGNLDPFTAADPKGRYVLEMLEQLSRAGLEQQQALGAELASLRSNVDHIKRIVSLQQGYAKVSGVAEAVDLHELLEDSIRMNADPAGGARLQIVRDFADVAPILMDKHKALQILVNLVRNAQHACAVVAGGCRITLALAEADGRVRITVADTGSGIAPENLARIFTHGFTTRKDGHGFGLHSGALHAAELGGSLSVQSEGLGRGAVFTLDLPATREREAHA